MKHSLLIATLLLSTASATPAFANADTRLPADTVLTAGGDATYLIKPDGAVWAWGSNSAGQIGDASSTNRLKPVVVSSAWCSSMSAGTGFVLCIMQDGSLYSWGINGFGQLGRTGAGNAPAQVGNASDWRTIEAGVNHSLGIKYDGTLYAWGSNSYGQLGLNDTTNRSTPTAVGSDSDWIDVAGSGFSLALKANGFLYGCGNNGSGQMANGGTAAGPKVFTQIGSQRWRAISAGAGHVMAIREDGTLWTWGQNDSSQVGNNSTAARTSPFQIAPVGASSVWRTINAGRTHSLAIGADGKLWGWGSNSKGQLGLGNFDATKTVPQQIGTSRSHQYIAAGENFSAILMADGSLKTFGDNSLGQLGINSTTNKNTMQTPFVTAGDGWASSNKPQVPGAGSFHSMLVSRSGSLKTWGTNGKGQLGDGTTNNTSPGNLVPAMRPSGNDWMVSTGGENCSYGIKADGSIYVWGTNNNGEMGTTTVPQNGVKTSPYQINTNSTWTKVQAHYAQVLALRADGSMWGSGDNFAGLLGVSSNVANIFEMTKVTTEANKYWAAMAVSERNSYAIRTDGTLWAAGDNTNKQIGRGTLLYPNGTNVFVQVGTWNDWVAVGTGTNWAVAVRANGQAYSWGANSGGNLGQGTTTGDVSLPQQVQGGYRIKLLATTRWAAIGAAPWGNVVGFGRNSNGELGVGNTTAVLTMQQVGYWGSRFIAGGAGHFVESNTFSFNGFASGYGTEGQIGDGAKSDRKYPVSITY